nr:DUF4336 domain-containing protein [Nostoc sp. DedQUE03]MDZ7975111.1 DUF4336 domain-containing protein [Nostoc sp. DedQUE03]
MLSYFWSCFFSSVSCRKTELDIDLKRGSFAEVAVFHKRSHTLLITDSVWALLVSKRTGSYCNCTDVS